MSKSWNSDGSRSTLVLGLHGWLDNAGTFDTLAALLPSSVYFVVFDFPGHGLSSSLPKGTNLHLVDFAYSVKRVMDHLSWEECFIVGHSMGSAVAQMFAAIFPECVPKILCLDQINTAPIEVSDLTKFRRRAFEAAMAEERGGGEIKTYTLDQSIQFTVGTQPGFIREESAKILAIRGNTAIDHGLLVPNRNQRYKDFHNFIYMTPSELDAYASGVRADVLLLRATDGFYTHYGSVFFSYSPKNARSFVLVEVEGGHHVHLDHPDRILQHFIKFFDISVNSKY